MFDDVFMTESKNGKYIYGFCSDKGNYRQVNEDAVTIKYREVGKHEVLFAAVCDGMGGWKKGEYASFSVINEFNYWFDISIEQQILNNPEEDIFALLADDIEEIILEQNKSIFQYGQEKKIRLGTTLTAMLLVDNEYCIAQIGDSRAYVAKQGLVQLTKDQSLIEEEIQKGKISREEAKQDKRRNIILQCIGAKEQVKPVFTVGIVEKESNYFLCSDGFVHCLNEGEMLDLMKPSNINSIIQAKNVLERGIQTVKERGEKDNISVVLLKVI